jgi:hypothetical protein
MAPIIEQPRKRPLHRPTPGYHLEAFPLFVERRFQVDCVCLLHATHPFFQPCSRRGAIDPYLALPLDTIRTILGSYLHQAQAIIHAGIGHDHGNDQPQRVHQDMPLAPFALLVAITPEVFVLGRCLDTLRVKAARRGLGLSSQTTSLPLAKRLHQACPNTVSAPALPIPLDGAPVAQFLRYQPPLAACRVEVQDTVDDKSYVAWWAPGSTGGPWAFGQQGLEQLPLLIGSICCIVIGSAHS